MLVTGSVRGYDGGDRVSFVIDVDSNCGFVVAKRTRIFEHLSEQLLLGIPQPRFRLNGTVYVLRSAGRRGLSVLRRVKYADASGQPMLPHRNAIRSVLRNTPVALLTFVIHESNDPIMLRLAIWILGRGRHQFATRIIYRHHRHPCPKVRLEVVRALRRVSAWALLRTIANESGCLATRQFANSEPQRMDFDTRLQDFTGLLSPRPISGVLRELVVAKDVVIPSGAKPKDRWTIRRVIQKIQRLVRLSRSRRPFRSAQTNNT